jgi:hypothetical protein
VSTPKTHILRAKPPWREGLDHTMCGRRAEETASVVPPDDAMAAKAKASFSSARGFKYIPPGGTCWVCWECLATFGYEKRAADPVKVLRIDLLVSDGRGREALHTEVLALASLAARHPGEFRELLEAEAVMQALAGIR